MPRLRTLTTLLVALFLDTLVYGLVVPVIPTYSARLGVAPARIGVLFAVYGVALLASTPLVGALAVRVERRTIIVAGLLGLALSTLSFAFVESFTGMLAARALQGIAAAASWTAGLALLSDMSPPGHRGRALGLSSTAFSLGALLGPPLGGATSDRWGMRAPFVLVALLAIITSVAAARALPKLEVARAPRSPLKLLVDRDVRALCALVALGAATFGMLEPMFPLDLSSRFGSTPGAIGLLFAAATISYGLAAPVVGIVADKLGAPRPLRAGWIAAAAALTFIALPSTVGVQICAMAVFGISLALLMTPALRALATAADRVGGDYAVAYAAYNAAYAVGLMIGASAGGMLVDALGSPSAFVAASCGVLVVGFWPAISLGAARA